MTGRVLQVIPSVSPIHGGPSVAIQQIEKALGSSSWRSETATTNDDGPDRRIARPLGSRVLEDGATRWYFNKSTEFYKVAWSFVPWIKRHAADYDLIHIHALFSFLSVTAAWAAKRAGVPYIVRPLGVLNQYGVTRHRPRIKRLSLRWIEGPILRHAAAVHFTAEAERDEALELGVSFRASVVPLGITLERSGEIYRARRMNHQPTEPVRLLFLSRLDPKKNLEGLIDALALLRRHGARVSLSVAGSGAPAYMRALVDRVQAMGVERHVRWLGHVSGKEKAEVFAAADIFVLPSFSENFGVSVAEAMAQGIPCIVGRGVALADVIVQAGAGLSVDTDPESIAAGIRHYIASPEARVRSGAAARALAEREFSVSKMGERLVELYDSVI